MLHAYDLYGEEHGGRKQPVPHEGKELIGCFGFHLVEALEEKAQLGWMGIQGHFSLVPAGLADLAVSTRYEGAETCNLRRTHGRFVCIQQRVCTADPPENEVHPILH